MAKDKYEDYDSSAASNADVGGVAIQGSSSLALGDNALREILSHTADHFADDTIASATTTDLGSKAAQCLSVTGTTTITGLGTIKAGTVKFLNFAGALTLTHNAASLILPGGADIGTAAGDTAIVRSLGSGNWQCLAFARAADAPLSIASQASMVAGISNNVVVPPGRQHFHPLMPKFLYAFNGTGTPAAIATAGVAVSSITDHGAGDWTLNLAASFTDALWFCFVTAQTNSSGQNDLIVTAFDKATGSVRIHAFDQSAGALADCTRIDVVGFGTLA